MMGHSTQKNSARLGFSDSNDSKDPEDEVNDYLMRAIDARSIDRLRSEHCKSVSLSFKKSSIEKKVKSKANTIQFIYYLFQFKRSQFKLIDFISCLFTLFLFTQYISEPDRMLAKYFFCSLCIFIGIMLIRILVYPL